MKYCVENNLSIFEFHDSIFSFVSFDGKDLSVSASMMNIHKNTEQNPTDCDMEIASALITFKNFKSATYKLTETIVTTLDGNTYIKGQNIVYSNEEAIERILEALRQKITILSFEKKDSGGYYMDGCSIDPYFIIEFDFDSVTVCWDEYQKKAWYELIHQYQYDVLLHTLSGDETVNLTVNINEENDTYKTYLYFKFKGKDYYGCGSDYLWIDAFADLQKRLPNGTFIKCCLTCRHGNMCPVGDYANEVFCTKDVPITQKSDLFYYTEDKAERGKRSKKYCELCEDYQPQIDEFYTYNDFQNFVNASGS